VSEPAAVPTKQIHPRIPLSLFERAEAAQLRLGLSTVHSIVVVSMQFGLTYLEVCANPETILRIMESRED